MNVFIRKNNRLYGIFSMTKTRISSGAFLLDIHGRLGYRYFRMASISDYLDNVVPLFLILAWCLQPSWRAKPASWAVLRLFWITCVYIYIYIYIYMFVRFGFPHYWLYTMLLTTHLPRGLRGLRTSNASWQTTVN